MPTAAIPHAHADHQRRLALAHQRSQRYGVQLRDNPHYQRLARADLEQALEQNRVLCQHAEPVMEHLYSQIANTGSMLVLTGDSGLVLRSLGDSDFLPKADRVALVPGVDWSERAQGTNAIGTALQERLPITVRGDQHFMPANHGLACSCAPIFDPYGHLLGALDVTGEHHAHHPHTLALVRMSVQMLENQMMLAQFPQAIRIHFHARPEFLGTLLEGIALVSPQGQLLSLNRSAQFQLGLTRSTGSSAPWPAFAQLFAPSLAQLLRTPTQQLLLHNGVRVCCHILEPTRAAYAPASASTSAETLTPSAPLANERHTAARLGTRPTQLSHLQYLDTGDAQLAHAIARLRKVLDRDIPVMLLGETGTGKDLLARAWHQDSARASQPFVAVNCASIPESLIESELFGYTDGAFTGARKKGAPGKIAQAHGGTLFLDEVGDMPLHLQTRLLHVLQSRCITPLGSSQNIPVDIAVVCATHQDLKARIASGQFREDLYYRLNGLAVRLPALRERSDLQAVIVRVLQAVQDAHQPPCHLDEAVLQLLLHYHWPGNVRQLHNVLRTACVMAGASGQITLTDLPDDFLEDCAQATLPCEQHAQPERAAPAASLNHITLLSMADALRQHQGNVSAAAKALGISRNTFYRKKAQLMHAQGLG